MTALDLPGFRWVILSQRIWNVSLTMALHVLNLGQGHPAHSPGMESSQMLGWMMVFALMTILATVATVAAGPSAGVISTKLAALVFGILFLATLLTSLVRRRT
jgi:hypothetical protein